MLLIGIPRLIEATNQQHLRTRCSFEYENAAFPESLAHGKAAFFSRGTHLVNRPPNRPFLEHGNRWSSENPFPPFSKQGEDPRGRVEFPRARPEGIIPLLV